MKIFIIVMITAWLHADIIRVEQLFSVQTVNVEKRMKALSVSSFGKASFRDQDVHIVAPRFSGYVVGIAADKTYMRVQKGDTLARVYSPEVAKAAGEYIKTKKYAALKSLHLSATHKLLAFDIDATQMTKHADKAIAIHAPTSGVIYTKNISNGSAFKAGSVLYSIVNIDKMWVEASLYEHQRSRVHVGDKVTVTFDAISKAYDATVLEILPFVNPKTTTISVRLELDNKNHAIFPNMYASVTFKGSEKTYLTLPKTAVIRKNGTHYVFVAGEYEGEYTPLEVKAKEIDANTYAIESGVKEGREVVNNALFLFDSDAMINGGYQK